MITYIEVNYMHICGAPKLPLSKSIIEDSLMKHGMAIEFY